MNRQLRRAGHDYRIKLLGGEYATNMTCREANCEAYRKGWLCVLDVSGETGAWQATWIREKSGRRFYQWAGPDALEEALRIQATTGDIKVTDELRAALTGLAPQLVVFAFPAGQQCFRMHEDREVVFQHNSYVHSNGRDFNEDFNETGDAVNRMLQRG